MSQKKLVLDALDGLGINYQLVEHAAVFTAQEMEALDFPPGSRIAKNLFLRDAKGRRHFLVTVDLAQKVDLKALEGILGSSKLSFGSEERLQKHLGLTKGSVTPLGLLNDTARTVEFFLEQALCGGETIGVHPNDNTATLLLTPGDLEKFAVSTGHTVHRFSLQPSGAGRCGNMAYEITEVLADKKRYLDLLLLGDEQEDMIDRYLEPGRLFVLRDEGVKCVAVVLELSDDTCELKNIATHPDFQGKGYGRAMVAHLLAAFLGRYRTMLVGTGDVPKALRFYEGCGFRPSHRVKDFFVDHYDHPIIEQGVQLRDMVYLRIDAEQ